MTTYTKRTNAKRAAIKAGIPEAEVEITVHKSAGESPRYGFKRRETQAAAPAKAVGKAQRVAAPKVPRLPREERNGVKRPRPGGLCAAVWQWLDAHRDATHTQVKEHAAKVGWNVNNASIEYYGYRRFMGLSKPQAKKAKEVSAKKAA